MIIVSGWLRLHPGRREAFLALSHAAIVAARAAPGCRALVVAADPIERDRANVYEEWADEAALLAFRQDGPSVDMQGMIASAEVCRHVVAESGPA